MLVAIGLPATFLALAFRIYTGFGFSILLVPMLAFQLGFGSSVLVAILCESVLCILLAYTYRGHLALREAIPLKMLSFVGALLALASSSVIPTGVVGVVAGLTVIALTIARITGGNPSTLRRMWLDKVSLAGVASGFIGYHSSISGPFIVLHYDARGEPSSDLRGKLAGYFLLLYMWLMVNRSGEICSIINETGGELLILPIAVAVLYPLLSHADSRLKGTPPGSIKTRRATGYVLLIIAGLALITQSLLAIDP